MKKLRYLVFCLVFSLQAASGLLPVFRPEPKPPVHVNEESPFLDARELD